MRTRAELLALINTLLPTNGQELIAAADAREVLAAIVEAAYNRADDAVNNNTSVPAWSAVLGYPAGFIVERDNRFWKSLQSENLNHLPVEGAWWTEVSASEAGQNIDLSQYPLKIELATAGQATVALENVSPQPGSAWEDITGKPITFPPSGHGHAITDVSDLQSALNGKEAAANKAINFTTQDNVKFPTVLAVVNYIAALFQSVQTIVATWIFSAGIRLGSISTPANNGELWYDPARSQFRGRRSGTNVDLISGNTTAIVVATPAFPNGTSGDKAGTFAVDSANMYFCFADWISPGAVPIWAKVPRVAGSQIALFRSVPATLTSAGTTGQRAWETTTSTMYECIGANTWVYEQYRSIHPTILNSTQTLVRANFRQIIRTTGAITITLPPTSGLLDGWGYVFINTDTSSSLIIAPNASQGMGNGTGSSNITVTSTNRIVLKWSSTAARWYILTI